MFARDVISQQVMEKHLLELQTATAAGSMLPATEDMTPECAEEFEHTCRSVAPVALLVSIDLQEQFRHAIGRRMN